MPPAFGLAPVSFAESCTEVPITTSLADSVVAIVGAALSTVNGSQELTAESLWFGSFPATYWALNE